MTLSICLKSYRVLIITTVSLLAIFAGVILVSARKSTDSSAAEFSQESARPFDSRTKTAQDLSRLPLSFEVNKGQVNEAVKFLSHGAGYDLFLTSTEAVIRVEKPRSQQVKLKDSTRTTSEDENIREGSVLRLKMLGANTSPEVE